MAAVASRPGQIYTDLQYFATANRWSADGFVPFAQQPLRALRIGQDLEHMRDAGDVVPRVFALDAIQLRCPHLAEQHADDLFELLDGLLQPGRELVAQAENGGTLLGPSQGAGVELGIAQRGGVQRLIEAPAGTRPESAVVAPHGGCARECREQ